MIAGNRLASLAGMSGVSASVMLQSIGAGTTAGSRLVAFSQLGSATAGVHLMTDPIAGAGAGENYIIRARRRLRR